MNLKELFTKQDKWVRDECPHPLHNNKDVECPDCGRILNHIDKARRETLEAVRDKQFDELDDVISDLD